MNVIREIADTWGGVTLTEGGVGVGGYPMAREVPPGGVWLAQGGTPHGGTPPPARHVTHPHDGVPQETGLMFVERGRYPLEGVPGSTMGTPLGGWVTLMEGWEVG